MAGLGQALVGSRRNPEGAEWRGRNTIRVSLGGNVALAAGLSLSLAAGTAAASSRSVNPQIAGLQVALSAERFYAGPVDAVRGVATRSAVRSLQRRRGLPVNGVATPATRRALGKLGGPLFGTRAIKRGAVGWDVAVLQFLLADHGFDVGTLDGRFGPLTRAAVVAFQRRARLAPDGIVGRMTRARLCPSRGCRSTIRPRRVLTSYRVQAGDTLIAIAARLGTTVADVAADNAIDPNGVLIAGTRLRLAGGGRLEAVWPDENTPASTVKAMIERAAARAGIASRLALAVAWIESGYQSDVRSSTGDWGPMQVSPPAWDFVESVVTRHAVPHTTSGNIRVGVLYLRRLLVEFDGDEYLAIAAYHQGAASVRLHGVLPRTDAYVAAVRASESCAESRTCGSGSS